jgi:hypothetical protein
MEGVLQAMSPNTLRTALVLALCLVVAGGISALSLMAQAPPAAKDEAPRPAADKGEGKLQKLLEERLKVAKQEVEARRKEFEAGKTTFEGMAEAWRRVLKAELDLATDKAARVAAYERYVKLLKQVSEVSKARYEAGRASFATYCEAEYLRLDAEIALEREKARK